MQSHITVSSHLIDLQASYASQLHAAKNSDNFTFKIKNSTMVSVKNPF